MALVYHRERFKGLDIVEIKLDQSADKFDVIAAWHPRYNEDALQKWIISMLQVE
jgi:hypothetical protein